MAKLDFDPTGAKYIPTTPFFVLFSFIFLYMFSEDRTTPDEKYPGSAHGILVLFYLIYHVYFFYRYTRHTTNKMCCFREIPSPRNRRIGVTVGDA